MKTATSGWLEYVTITLDFQFPIRWDEDCNDPELIGLDPVKLPLFQFPIRWDEDCNPQLGD